VVKRGKERGGYSEGKKMDRRRKKLSETVSRGRLLVMKIPRLHC